MATHDYVIANGTGAAVRSDLNNALAAIVSNNSGSSEPSTTYAYQWWADTNDNVLKLRNSANNGWITLRELDGTMLMGDGSVSAPYLAFATDLDTGLFRSADNRLNFATGGTERLELGSSEVVFNDPSNDVDFRVESNGNTHMLFVDAGNDRCGIGTSSPDVALDVVGEAIVGNGTYGVKLTYSAGNTSGIVDTANSADKLEFRIQNSEKMRIDSSGRLLVGTSTTNGKLYGTTGINHSIQTEVTNAFAQSWISHGTPANYGAHLTIGRSRGTSAGAVTIVQAGDNLGQLSFQGADGTDCLEAAQINAEVDGTPGSNDMPGRLVFSTTADGAASATERARINSAGQVLVGQTSATSVLGNGVGIKSNDVGTSWNEGALSLTGTGGDFYGLTFSKSGSNTAEGFGVLAVFSSGTDVLQFGYDSGSSPQSILNLYQNGNVNVVAALSKGSGSFKIDHPLPAKTETHNLVHSFIEGPQADLIYRGKIDLVAGAATVNLDTAARMTEGTFVLLNTNTQCFTTNESDWTAVRGSVSGNILTIAAEDNTSTATVSWMVIGERQDQHMLDTDWTDDNGRVITEPEKPS
jgi:hypothetical protein|tara:strand:+ start:771 stop:2513 length:1743 start_codon:yes stop_codon:yes gene_type:complete